MGYRILILTIVLCLGQSQISTVDAFILRGSISNWDSIRDLSDSSDDSETSPLVQVNLPYAFHIGADIADGRQTVYKVRPDSGGYFWIRSIFPILRVWIEDKNGRIYGKREGPWAKDTEIKLSFREP